MSGTPRPYDENFIEEQLRGMRRSNWTVQAIAGWFARWGYEEGKAVFLMLKSPSPTPVNSNSFTRIPISEVRTGHLARCGDQEFLVAEVCWGDGGLVESIRFANWSDPLLRYQLEWLGFTFWRKAVRAPRVWRGPMIRLAIEVNFSQWGNDTIVELREIMSG